MNFGDIKEFWNKHGFEIVLGLCVAFILIFALYRKISGKRGSWSSSYYYSGKQGRPQPFGQSFGRSPPKESRGELECRDVLQNLFGKPFNKARPDFLRNPVTGGSFNLELDCYNPELKLAVEYNGAQHYKYIPYFHKNKEAFLNQKYRDLIKLNMCKDNRITLIEVPHTIEVPQIRGYLITKLKENGYKV